MNGKGILIWQGKNWGDGSPQAAAQACKDMGLSWVGLKIGDDASPKYASYADMPAAVRVFRAAGLFVWGWHYVYGGVRIRKDGTAYRYGPSPEQEAAFAVKQVADLGLDGYIMDPEKEYKVMEPAPRAALFTAGLMRMRGPIALCSYRFPRLHPEFPWTEFLAAADVHMPQVYWGPGRAVPDLDQSASELLLKRRLPFVPVGRAYIGDGHPGPTQAEVRAFMQRAEDRGCPGLSFWALDFLQLHKGGSALADVIRQFVWSPVVVPPPPPPVPTGDPNHLHATVQTDGLLVRSAPHMTGEVLGHLTSGAKVDVLDIGGTDAWAQIMFNGKPAWTNVCLGNRQNIKVD